MRGAGSAIITARRARLEERAVNNRLGTALHNFIGHLFYRERENQSKTKLLGTNDFKHDAEVEFIDLTAPQSRDVIETHERDT